MDPRPLVRAAAAAILPACVVLAMAADGSAAQPRTARAGHAIHPAGVVRLEAEPAGRARVVLTAAEQPGGMATVEALPVPPPPAPLPEPVDGLGPPAVVVLPAAAPAWACDPWARLRRAGNPQCVAPWARFTYGPKYCGYYVGGGAALYGEPGHLHGEPRYPHEGTWGMDYAPWYSRVRLNWFHGTRYQGGEGQYEPDHKNNPFEDFITRP